MFDVSSVRDSDEDFIAMNETNRTDFPRVVAVSCAIPLHGVRVLLEVEGDSGKSNSLQLFRICQTMLDPEIQWCAKVPHREIQAGPPLPIPVSPLLVYCVPTVLPKRYAAGALPVKLRSDSGIEVSLHWPFSRSPGQTLQAFEDTILNIRVIDVDTPSIVPPGIVQTSLLKAIICDDFGEYEADMVLEAHRVFEVEKTFAKDIVAEEVGCEDTDDVGNNEEYDNEVEIVDNIVLDEEERSEDKDETSTSVDNHDDIDRHTLDYLLYHDDSNDSEDNEGECTKVLPGALVTNGDVQSTFSVEDNQAKSLHDIMMGDSDSEVDQELNDVQENDRQVAAMDEIEAKEVCITPRGPELDSLSVKSYQCTDSAKKRKKTRHTESISLGLAKTLLARQLFLAEWEAELHFSRVCNKTNRPRIFKRVVAADESPDDVNGKSRIVAVGPTCVCSSISLCIVRCFRRC